MTRTRLDLYLTKNHPQLSRTEIKKKIDEGLILVDGQVRKPSYLLRGGEEITYKRTGPPPPPVQAEKLPLTIIYEDEAILIVNKAAGMVVHPAHGNYTGTLVNALLHHLAIKESGDLGRAPTTRAVYEHGSGRNPRQDPIPLCAIRPGIVHRLDKGTSGVMVIAKTSEALKNLSAQFKGRTVKKVYQALVFGKFPLREGTINLAIGRDQQHRRKFSSKTRYSREAVTHYKVQQEFPGLSLLEAHPVTGRTHQIRVHLSENRHPIVGDTVYGAKSYLSIIKDESIRTLLEAITRPLLHAARLSFNHPESGERVEFSAELPDDFKSVLEGMAG